MLDQFFNVDTRISGTEYYLNRSIIVGGIIITAMRDLGKDLSGISILEIFQCDQLLKEIQDEYTNKFPDSDTTRFIHKLETTDLDGYFKFGFELVKLLIPRLELKDAISA